MNAMHKELEALRDWCREQERVQYDIVADKLDALLREGGWRPIETAPKDGTFIFLTDVRHMPCYLIARWFHGKWWGQATNSGRAITWDSATHWQPLPELPAITGDSR